jgi:hypothetical protein
MALDLIPEIGLDFFRVFGRDSGGLLKAYKTQGAETIVVALGSSRPAAACPAGTASSVTIATACARTMR